MPRTREQGNSRVNVRIPKPIINEIERLIRKMPYLTGTNRQQFIESAIKEKIFKIKQLEANLKSTS